MPFEKPDQPPATDPDRKLGDEWVDWDGTRQQDNTETPAWVFVVLTGLTMASAMALGGLALWLVAPRLSAFGTGWLVWVIAAAGAGYLLAWYLSLLLGTQGLGAGKQMVRFLGGIRWAISPAVTWGKVFGLSRDRVGHAFVRIYNRLEVLPPLIQDPVRLLLLAPRCLGRESMQGLRALKDAYGFSQVVAFGGTEARKGIAQHRPQGIVAVACERDLLVGIKDLHGRIPVLAFSIRRPDGPCKNTVVDLTQIEEAIRMFLGQPGKPAVK